MFGGTRFGASSYGGDENVELIEKHPGFGSGATTSPSDGSGSPTSPSEGSGEAEVTSFGSGTSTIGDA